VRQQGRNSKDLVNAQKTGDRKAGVVWHTQGSGKSLSMVFYTGKIVLALDNPTVVVITDRNDLMISYSVRFLLPHSYFVRHQNRLITGKNSKNICASRLVVWCLPLFKNSSLMMAAISMSCCQTELILSLSLMKHTVHSTVSAPKKLT
jgi:hypothetical protein